MIAPLCEPLSVPSTNRRVHRMQTTDTVHVAGIGDRAPSIVLDVLVKSFLDDAAKRAAEDARQRRGVEDSQKENTDRLRDRSGFW